MKMEILKESIVEYCENVYALAINHLKNHENPELKKDLEFLSDLEDAIRDTKDMNKLNEHRDTLNKLLDRIEGVINEQ